MINKEDELKRLATLYFERKQEFEKAHTIRWILAFVGFTIFYFSLLIKFDTSALFRSSIINILILTGIAMVFAFGHLFVNLSIFGGLIQKDISENRRLDDIVKQIEEIQKGENIIV